MNYENFINILQDGQIPFPEPDPNQLKTPDGWRQYFRSVESELAKIAQEQIVAQDGSNGAYYLDPASVLRNYLAKNPDFQAQLNSSIGALKQADLSKFLATNRSFDYAQLTTASEIELLFGSENHHEIVPRLMGRLAAQQLIAEQMKDHLSFELLVEQMMDSIEIFSLPGDDLKIREMIFVLNDVRFPDILPTPLESGADMPSKLIYELVPQTGPYTSGGVDVPAEMQTNIYFAKKSDMQEYSDLMDSLASPEESSRIFHTMSQDDFDRINAFSGEDAAHSGSETTTPEGWDAWDYATWGLPLVVGGLGGLYAVYRKFGGGGGTGLAPAAGD